MLLASASSLSSTINAPLPAGIVYSSSCSSLLQAVNKTAVIRYIIYMYACFIIVPPFCC